MRRMYKLSRLNSVVSNQNIQRRHEWPVFDGVEKPQQDRQVLKDEVHAILICLARAASATFVDTSAPPHLSTDQI